MPRLYQSSARRKQRPPHITVVEQVGRETLAALILAACAVARADGTADRSERRALLAFLRERGILARHGRQAVLAAYDAAAAGGRPSLAETAGELAALDRLAGTRAAPLIAAAAHRVALADGIAWPQEAALLGIIGERLGLRVAQARS